MSDSAEKSMTHKQRELARHALGLPNKKRMSYRNHFCAGPNHSDYADWEDLVAKGLAVKRSSNLCGGDDFFHLTLNGALMVREAKEHLCPEDTARMRQIET